MRLGAALLLCLVTALAIDGSARLVPGPFSLDDVTYELMAKNLADGHGLFVSNGYEELPSIELATMQVHVTDGHLAARYPPGHTFLALPFYLLFGYSGLFVSSGAAFVAAVWLCHRIGRRLFSDARLALASAALFAFGTYAWVYALAVSPHALGLAFGLGATSLTMDAWVEGRRGRASMLAFGAGFACGLGTTTRLDLAFLVPALVAPFVFGRRARWREALAFLAGLLPSLCWLSVANLEKWHTLSPFSYGPALRAVPAMYVPFFALAVAGVVGLWVVTRPKVLAGILRSPRQGAALAAASIAIVLLVPAARHALGQLSSGVFVTVVDMSALRADRIEPAMLRTASGSVVYAGGLKKALLQSCPFLPAAVVSVVSWIRAGRSRALLWLLTVPPLTYVLFFGYLSWHGGLSLNMRYLLPVLPAGAVLVTATAFEIELRAPRATLVALAASATTAALFFGWRNARRDIGSEELLLLGFPIALTVAVAAAATLWSFRPSRAAGFTCAALLGAGVAFSTCVTFAYDLERARGLMARHGALGAAVAELVADDSLLFADYPDDVYAAIETRRRLRIALPSMDRFEDFRRLAAFHLRASRHVYGLHAPNVWHDMFQSGLLAGFRFRAIALIGPYELRELALEN